MKLAKLPNATTSQLVISPYRKKGREVIAELILGDEVSHNLYPETKDNVKQSVTILDESCVRHIVTRFHRDTRRAS